MMSDNSKGSWIYRESGETNVGQLFFKKNLSTHFYQIGMYKKIKLKIKTNNKKFDSSPRESINNHDFKKKCFGIFESTSTCTAVSGRLLHRIV